MPNQIVGQNPEMLELWMCLPDDILMHIFQFLPASSLLKAAQVWICSMYVFVHVVHICLNPGEYDIINKKLSYCWETVRCESMPRIAEMDVEMTT